ncbi:hypothetical protein [Paenibacillus sp. LPE1-1-1.1]
MAGILIDAMIALLKSNDRFNQLSHGNFGGLIVMKKQGISSAE